MKITDQELKRKAATYGLMLGVLVIADRIISYYTINGITASPLVITMIPYAFLLVIPVLALIFCGRLRKAAGNYWIFKEAVTGIFIMLLVSNLLNFVVTNLLFARVIEPGIISKTQATLIDATGSVMVNRGDNPTHITKRIADMRQQFTIEANTSPVKAVTEIGISTIFIFVISLGFGTMYKRDPPQYRSVEVDPTA